MPPGEGAEGQQTATLNGVSPPTRIIHEPPGGRRADTTQTLRPG